MIRKGSVNDIDEIAKIYEKIVDREPARIMTGWQKGIYPVKQTALDAHNRGDLFVMEIDGEIVAAATINQIQMKEYTEGNWEFSAPDSEVMVIHTLVVDPEKHGKGYGPEFISFYEKYALENGCTYLRLDTNEKNSAARRFYQKLGYKEVGTVSCDFNGIKGVRLVCIEKKLEA